MTSGGLGRVRPRPRRPDRIWELVDVARIGLRLANSYMKVRAVFQGWRPRRRPRRRRTSAGTRTPSSPPSAPPPPRPRKGDVELLELCGLSPTGRRYGSPRPATDDGITIRDVSPTHHAADRRLGAHLSPSAQGTSEHRTGDSEGRTARHNAARRRAMPLSRGAGTGAATPASAGAAGPLFLSADSPTGVCVRDGDVRRRRTRQIVRTSL
jgi:hypothetical protein